jgi:hypothetical protein
MPAKEILDEAEKLHQVGDSLQGLANSHPIVEDALNIISVNVHHSASLLEVVVAIKVEPRPGFNGVN